MIRVGKIAPHEAQNMLDEYNLYCADGPPYDTPNGEELRRRDNRIRIALYRKGRDYVLTRSSRTESKHEVQRSSRRTPKERNSPRKKNVKTVRKQRRTDDDTRTWKRRVPKTPEARQEDKE